MGEKTDLEITKKCAEAMGYEAVQWSNFNRPSPSAHAAWISRRDEKPPFNYDPLNDDAQAMALVKKFELQLTLRKSKGNPNGKGWAAYRYGYMIGGAANNEDLNRAICECIAKLGAEHE